MSTGITKMFLPLDDFGQAGGPAQDHQRLVPLSEDWIVLPAKQMCVGMPLGRHCPDTLVWEFRWDAISHTNVSGNAVGTGTPFPRHICPGMPLGRHFVNKFARECRWDAK